MNELQSIKRQLLPLLKGMPFIVVVFLAALFLANRFVNYTVPRYKSTARIKLDDQTVGISNNNLYKDFDVLARQTRLKQK